MNAYPEYVEYGPYPDGRISGPTWINDEYSVAVKIPRDTTAHEVTQMLRNLIAERFGLMFHEENKQASGFELTVGQSGFKLTSSTSGVKSAPSNPGTHHGPYKPKQDRQGFPILSPEGTWGASFDHESRVIRVSFSECSMGKLASMLSTTYGESSVPVTDKTGIEGVFDFHLVLPIPSARTLPADVAARFPTSSQMPPAMVQDASIVDLRDLSGSLERQIGLRLKATKVTLRGMVIDSVARTPTEN